MLLALGSAMHIWLYLSPPVRFGHLAYYIIWLLFSFAFALYIWSRPLVPRPMSARESQMHQASSRLGLSVFVLIATVGLVIHLFGPYPDIPSPSVKRTDFTRGRAMSTIFVFCAGGCWGLLRGAPGDRSAPIPDGSGMARAFGWLRRLTGIAIACWGAWLFVLGIQRWGQSTDGYDLLLNMVFVVGGPLWCLVGMAIALRRGRGDA